MHGSYSEFLEQPEEFLRCAQSRRQEALANKVRREVEWLRRGPKARTDEVQGPHRQGRAHDRRTRRHGIARSRAGPPQIDFTASGPQDQAAARSRERIAKELGGRTLFRDLELILAPGTRFGLLGPNGSGKTTLLRILAGEIAADAGTVDRADGLRIVYFDQDARAARSRRDRCGARSAPEGDTVILPATAPSTSPAGRKRFLFRAEQLDVPVRSLSGGEQARVLIARLMLQPADLLLLDEPTNDLDIPTLEVLEESLTEFPGALVLVTHDRYMLDRVSTTVLGLDGEGGAESVRRLLAVGAGSRRKGPRTRARGPFLRLR